MHISAPQSFGSWRDSRESPDVQFVLKSAVGGGGGGADLSKRAPQARFDHKAQIPLRCIQGRVSLGSRCTLAHHEVLGVGGISGNPRQCSLTLSQLWAGGDASKRAPTGPYVCLNVRLYLNTENYQLSITS